MAGTPHVEEPARRLGMDHSAVEVECGPRRTASVRFSDHTVESVGFTLLLVHLDEVIATRDTTEPLRIMADRLQWPGERRRRRGHRR